jgi:hypothetical protein
MSPVIVLTGVGVMAVLVVMILAVLIVGIHRGDRRDLTGGPRSVSDAIARRVLLGVRCPESPADAAESKKWPNL